jgi:flagellar basal-body rod modification protein FlgD
MSTTSAVSGTTGTSSDTTTSTTQKTLDQDAFLKLLITEMQNQDPLSPMDNTEYVAQLAQFSSLEQMQQMNSALDSMSTSYSSNQALSLVGKTVTYKSPDDATTTLTGTVSGVVFEDGTAKLKIGSDTVGLDAVEQIYTDSSLGVGQKSQYALQLIGQTVDYYTTSGEYATGKVDSVSYENGWPTLNIGSNSVSLSNVAGIHQTADDIESDQAATIAAAMVGKNVVYTDPSDSTKTLTGVPSSVTKGSDGNVQLLIGTTKVDLADVVKVYAKDKS